MYKFQFQIPLHRVGEVAQRIADAEKAADPYNDHSSKLTLTTSSEFNGSVAVIWKTGSRIMAKSMLRSMGFKFKLDLA